MPKILSSCIEEVKRRAAIEEVAPAWGVVLKPKGANLVGLCPFHSEKSGSFTVQKGKGFRCFGCGEKGDAVGLVMKIDGVDFLEAIRRLADKFGVMLEYDRVPLPAAAGPASVPSSGAIASSPNSGGPAFVLPAGVDEAAARRAMKRQANFERQLEQEKRLQEQLLQAWLPKVAARRVPGWSAVVADRWRTVAPCSSPGVCPQFSPPSCPPARPKSVETEAKALADQRGWPEAWAWWLIEEDLIAWPVLPWGGDKAIAFRVDCPRYGPSGVEIEPVGYHQRFEINGERSWVYVPYSKDNFKTAFQRAMLQAERDRRPPEDFELSLTPGLPFVMGRVDAGVCFLVIAEGQWDAVTFAGACGWLAGECSWPEGVVVMGVRGASGVDTLLAYWGEWLEAVRPAVLVLADNDVAGLKWDTPLPLDKSVPGSPLGPTFAEKLLRRPGLLEDEPEWIQRVRRVEVRRVGAQWGKDFNDYWKKARPSPEKMLGWLHGMGFCDAGGRWR